MLPCDFAGSGLPLIKLDCPSILIIGLLPGICDVLLDYRGTNKGNPIDSREAVVGTICFSPVTGEITFSPTASHTRILIDKRESDYVSTVPVDPGALFTFGVEPYETSFLVVPTRFVDPMTAEDASGCAGTHIESSSVLTTDLEKKNLGKEMGPATEKWKRSSKG